MCWLNLVNIGGDEMVGCLSNYMIQNIINIKVLNNIFRILRLRGTGGQLNSFFNQVDASL